MFEDETHYELKVENEKLKAELRQAKNLLSKIHKATSQFYSKPNGKVVVCPYEEILQLYQKILPHFPKVVKLGSKRKASMRERWVNDLSTVNDWEVYFSDVKTKPFLAGKNDRKWKAGFDFLIKEATIISMQEGKYNG